MWKQSKFQCFRFQLLLKFMLPSSLPLPQLWNFLLPLPALERSCRFRIRFRFQSLSSKCFRFQKNLTASTASASTSLLNIKQLIVFNVKKQTSLLRKLFYLTCVVDRAYGMEWRTIFPYSTLAIFLHSIPKIFHSIFHSILKFFSIFHSIFSYQRKFRLEAMQLVPSPEQTK